MGIVLNVFPPDCCKHNVIISVPIRSESCLNMLRRRCLRGRIFTSTGYEILYLLLMGRLEGVEMFLRPVIRLEGLLCVDISLRGSPLRFDYSEN